ncbi:hypothetical protein T439DRAFT_379632 [Meredithblackwellia eburnea MCA 4105]
MDEFDDSDDDFNWNDPSLVALDQQLSRSAPPAPAPAGPGPAIPAKRQLQNNSIHSIKRPPILPNKRKRLDQQQQSYVHPNPFLNKQLKHQQPANNNNNDDDDDNLPEITLTDTGYSLVQQQATTTNNDENPAPSSSTVVPPAQPSHRPSRPIQNQHSQSDTHLHQPPRHQTAVVTPPPPSRPQPTQQPKPPPPNPPQPPVNLALNPSVSANNPAAQPSGSGLSSAEKQELLQLRLDKAKLETSLKEFEQNAHKTHQELVTKAGEVAIIRGKLTKVEKTLLEQMSSAKTEKEEMEAKIKENERQLKRALDQAEIQNAFRRNELETSAKRQTWSRSKSVQHGPHSSTREGSMGPPPFPAHVSPTLGRRRGGSVAPSHSQKPQQQPKSFGGFQNSFLDSPSESLSSHGSRARSSSRRAESMPPPPVPLTRDRKGVLSPRKDKGKGKAGGMMLPDDSLMEEDESEDRMALDSGDVSAWRGARSDDSVPDGFGGDWNDMDTEVRGAGVEGEEEEGEEFGDEWDWLDVPYQPSGEIMTILSLLFKHQTFAPVDTSSVITSLGPATSQLRSSMSASSSGSTWRPTASSRLSVASSATVGGTAGAASQPLTPTPTGPQPTFYSLTNLRFPATVPPDLIHEYEETCRQIFVILGTTSSSPSTTPSATLGAPPSLVNLTIELGRSLETLFRLLELGGLLGPLCSLVSLCASLVLLVPSFARFFTNVPVDTGMMLPPTGKSKSKMLVMLNNVLRKYGKPTTGGGVTTVAKVREKARKVRLSNRSAVINTSAAGGGLAAGGMGDKDVERVELEPVKRNALVAGCLELLEVLAWKLEEIGEDCFIAFLEGDSAIPTLLDPNQPIAIQTNSVRLLGALACHGTLFRQIVGIAFHDASDTRSSKVPIFDRVGTLLARSNSKAAHEQIYALDMCLITFVQTLAMKNTDGILFITQSPSLIPELLDKVFKDTRTVWEFDGMHVSDTTSVFLRRVVTRLSSSVHLFYYLVCAPKSILNITEFFTQSNFLGLHDRFTVAFGTLSFAALPDWAAGKEEGITLTELAYLAGEIMEDVSPQEAEEIESCFMPLEEDAMDEEDGYLPETDVVEEEDESVLLQAHMGSSQN